MNTFLGWEDFEESFSYAEAYLRSICVLLFPLWLLITMWMLG